MWEALSEARKAEVGAVLKATRKEVEGTTGDPLARSNPKQWRDKERVGYARAGKLDLMTLGSEVKAEQAKVDKASREVVGCRRPASIRHHHNPGR